MTWVTASDAQQTWSVLVGADGARLGFVHPPAGKRSTFTATARPTMRTAPFVTEAEARAWVVEQVTEGATA